MKKSTVIQYSVASGISLLISAGVASIKGLFSAQNTTEAFFALSDSFFVPTVLFIGIGLLLLISGEGVFDMLSYGFNVLGRMFSFLTFRQVRRISFLDYKAELEEKREKRSSPVFILIVGLADLVIALLFWFLYTKT